MSWLIFGIAPPLLWALVNHTDKYLLAKAHHRSSVGVLMMYSTSFSVVVIPILFVLCRKEIFLSIEQAVAQLIGGILLSLSIYFYLLALNKGETSVVMPFALLVPVFDFVFSYFLIGETLSLKEIIACLLVIGGALILSLEFEEESKLKIRHGVVIFMILATASQAAQESLFKFETVQSSFLVSVFWLHVGILLTGLTLLAFKKNLLDSFISSLRQNGVTIFGLNVVSEVVSTGAYIVRNFAVLIAPVAVIATLNGYQPLFVFIIGTLLTIFAPHIANEKIKAIHLAHKLVAILIILFGTLLISQSL